MAESAQSRVFLVVVDETAEHHLALHYAARRVAHTGGRLVGGGQRQPGPQ